MRTLSTILICLVLSTTASVALAQDNHAFVEVQTGTSDLFGELTLDGGLSHALPHDFSLSAFFLVKGGWAEAHVGPRWTPLDWLSFGASLGGSQSGEGEFNLRTAYSLRLKYGQASFSGTVEMDHQAYGGDCASCWYDLNLMYQAMDWLAIGFKDRRPLGVGPVVRFSVESFEFWAVWAPVAAEGEQVEDGIVEEELYHPEIFHFGVNRSF